MVWVLKAIHTIKPEEIKVDIRSIKQTHSSAAILELGKNSYQQRRIQQTLFERNRQDATVAKVKLEIRYLNSITAKTLVQSALN